MFTGQFFPFGPHCHKNVIARGGSRFSNGPDLGVVGDRVELPDGSKVGFENLYIDSPREEPAVLILITSSRSLDDGRLSDRRLYSRLGFAITLRIGDRSAESLSE